MADRNDAPVLDLQTLGVGVPIRIDGRRYHVAHPNKLSLEKNLILERLMPRVSVLLIRVEALEKKERAELSGLLSRLCALILDAPPSVQKGLTDSQRITILQVFIDLRTAPRRTGAATPVKARPSGRRPTGARSSRGSPASTAARQLPGSGTSRLVS